MTPGLYRGLRKALRTIVQLVAAGGLTAAVNAFADGLAPNMKALVGAAWLVAVTFAQNAAETAGRIPVLLPTPGLVPSVGAVAGTAVGTVETAVDVAGDSIGDVTGTVESVAGDLLGEVGPPGEVE